MTNRFNVNETRESISTFDLLGSKGDSLNKNAFMYNLLYNNHFDYLVNLVTNLFTWKNLPESKSGQKMRSSFFERILMYGSACISDVTELGLIITPVTVEGLLNPWGNPVRVRLSPPPFAQEFSSINKTLDSARGDKFVFVRNDNFCTGFFPLILQTTENLTVCYMSMLANINGQKFPFVFRGAKDSRLEMEIVKNKIDSYEQYIMLKDTAGFDVKDMSAVVNKEIPFVADKLYNSYIDILNNFFLRIGINNLPNAKKERMLVDEVNSNNQAVVTSGDIYLNCRKEACEEANKMFSINISVERNTDFIESIKKTPFINDIKGGVDDE